MKTISIFAPIIFLTAQAQDSGQLHLDQLNRFSGNKLILVGDWGAEDLSVWNKMLTSEDLSEYDFKLLGRANEQWAILFRGDDRQNAIRNFETWIGQQSGSFSSRWAALDGSNRVISSGRNIPEAKALASAMERFGIRSTLGQLRDFLREHPNHIDARTDLLKEVRRRALIAAPKDISEDLGTGDDLRTWGVLAREFDLAMNRNWIGFNLEFFRPEEDQPEQFSPLMKNAFRKHIGRVEDAIREFPTNENLWDVWAWMARALGNRPVFQFVKSLEKPTFSVEHKCPPPKVAAWLTDLAKSKEDWETVIELARIGRSFDRYTLESIAEWSPNALSRMAVVSGIPGYPEKSAYYPLIEALLKLGRIEEANDVFDELIRFRGAGNAQNAAAIAKSGGFEELAEAWSKGALTKPVPDIRQYWQGRPMVIVLAEYGGPEYQQANMILNDIAPLLTLSPAYDVYKDSLGWTGDDFRWALVDGGGLVVAQGTEMPNSEELQKVVSENNIKTEKMLAEEFLQNNPNHIEALISFGINSINESINALKKANAAETLLNSNQDDAIWGKTVSSWAKILDHENALFAVPTFYPGWDNTQSPTMKSLSRRYLPKIEAAVRQSPRSESLWNLWLFWRRTGDREREFEPMLESIAPSPMQLIGTCPPDIVLNEYYRECIENNQWPQIIKLLKEPWDRQISKQIAENDAKARTNEKPKLLYAQLGDNVGFPLIFALMQTGRRQEADEIFKTWLDCGGSFSNPADLVELARRFGGERLAGEWGEKMKKQNG